MSRQLFWSYVDNSGGDDACWIWRGGTLRGYGRCGGVLAHRRTFQLAGNVIPEGLELDHLCRNTLCVNPAHLEPVTRAENMRRRYAHYTVCKNGHEFTPENTYLRPSASEGLRSCRACNRAAAARYKARRASASRKDAA